MPSRKPGAVAWKKNDSDEAIVTSDMELDSDLDEGLDPVQAAADLKKVVEGVRCGYFLRRVSGTIIDTPGPSLSTKSAATQSARRSRPDTTLAWPTLSDAQKGAWPNGTRECKLSRIGLVCIGIS